MQKTKSPRSIRSTLGTVDGDLQLGLGAIVRAKEETVKIKGTLTFDSDVSFEGNLTANSIHGKGRLAVKGSLEVAVGVVLEEGSLEVSGNIRTKTIDVDQHVTVGGNLDAETVAVGANVLVKGETTARTVNVGGSFECSGSILAEEVLAGGSIIAGEVAKIEKIDVGGSASLAGGESSKLYAVAETLRSSEPLTVQDLDVAGSLFLTGNNKGRNIQVGGRVRVEGNLKLARLDVGGRTEITGSCTGVSATVGGKLDVGGSLTLSDQLKVGTGIKVAEELRAKSLELAGTFYAKRAEIQGPARIGGMITTHDGFRASKIQTAENWEARGPLVGDEVELSKKVDAEDVYAVDLNIADEAKARNIHATRIRIGNNCTINGVIEYTESIEVGQGLVASLGPPRKVRHLTRFRGQN